MENCESFRGFGYIYIDGNDGSRAHSLNHIHNISNTKLGCPGMAGRGGIIRDCLERWV